MTRKPTYVKFKPVDGFNHPCCLRWDSVNKEYWRDAGHWAVKVKILRGKIFIDCKFGPGKHLDGMELVKCSKEEWQNDNRGYV